MARIAYRLAPGSDESNKRLARLHANVMKYGTVYNLRAAGTELPGEMRRAPPDRLPQEAD